MSISKVDIPHCFQPSGLAKAVLGRGDSMKTDVMKETLYIKEGGE